MAIRIRQHKGYAVALCAAKTKAKEGDIYLGDEVHHALSVKFALDFESEGFMENPPVDDIDKKLLLDAERR